MTTPERVNPSTPWVALPELDLALRLDRGRLVASPLVSFEEGGATALNARAFDVDPFTFGDEQRAVLEDAQARLRRADVESDLYLFDSQFAPATVFFEERLGRFTLEDLETISLLDCFDSGSSVPLDERPSAAIGGRGGGAPVSVVRVRRTPVRTGDPVKYYREVHSRAPYVIPREAAGRVTLVTRDEIHVTLDREITAGPDAGHTLSTVVYRGDDLERGRDVFFLDTMPASAA